jgi:hypothetical protein
MRIDFGDPPDDGTDCLACYLGSAVFVAGLVLAGAIGWYF